MDTRDFYDLFDCVQRAQQVGFFDVECDTDRKQQVYDLAAILDEDCERIEVCLYLLDVYANPVHMRDELFDAAYEFLTDFKDIEDIYEELDAPRWVIDAIVQEALQQIEEEDDE